MSSFAALALSSNDEDDRTPIVNLETKAPSKRVGTDLCPEEVRQPESQPGSQPKSRPESQPESQPERWTTVSYQKIRPPRPNKIYTEEEAELMEKRFNIYFLAAALTSDRARSLQEDGYHFDFVYKPNTSRPLPTTTCRWDVQIVDISNQWGDKIVFKKRLDFRV